MFCTSCGIALEPAARHCVNCGSPCFVPSPYATKSAMPSSIVEDTTRRFDYPAASWNAEAALLPAPSDDSVWSHIKRHKLTASLTVVFLLLVVLIGVLRSSSHPSRAAVHIDDPTSLAVVASSCCGPGPSDLSERISANVRNSLTALPQVKVIAAGYKSGHFAKEDDPAAIGRELGVRTLLTVRAVRRGQDDFTVDAALIDTRDRRQLWGQQYQGAQSNLQSVQAEISRDITEKLKPRLTNEKP